MNNVSLSRQKNRVVQDHAFQKTLFLMIAFATLAVTLLSERKK